MEEFQKQPKFGRLRPEQMNMGTMDPKNEQVKAIGAAIGASVIAAVTTMLVPKAVLEGITGATGLSEIVHATAAPLGDTARALIAFSAGTITMILVLAYLMRKTPHSVMSSAAPAHSYDERQDVAASGQSLLQRIKMKIASIPMPTELKTPWSRNGDPGDVFDLSDLPQLRAQDTHPDSPARKPISALNDLDEAGLTGKAAPLPSVAEHVFMPEQPEQVMDKSHAFEAETKEEEAHYAMESVAAPHEAQSTLSDLVSQLEAAVENRKAQLAALEIVAAQLAAEASIKETAPIPAATPSWPIEQSQPAQSLQGMAPSDYVEPKYVQPLKRPSLEVVPNAAHTKSDEDMDAALNAALATLQRMNAK
jgi:hypothetical protein